VFEQYTQFIHQHFPNLKVEGANYPPPRPRQISASVLSMVKIAIILCILFGEQLQIWQSLNMTPPEYYVWASQNKFYAIMMVFFILNTVETQLISTGAFEIFYNDMPIWSKLQASRLPSPDELFQIIQNQVSLQK